jgi:MHS family proline/betaine transporter-like MFS transporter
MGIACNLAVAIFGGTAPFIIALIELTGDDLSIAYYLMAAAAAALQTE